MSQTSAPQLFAQSARVCQRRRPADPGRELALELALELRRRKNVRDAVLEPRDRGHQRLGHVTAAERPEAAVAVRQAPLEQRASSDSRSFGSYMIIDFPPIARTRATNSLILTRVLLAAAALDATRDVDAPGPHGPDRVRDVVGSSPPARISSRPRASSRASFQSASAATAALRRLRTGHGSAQAPMHASRRCRDTPVARRSSAAARSPRSRRHRSAASPARRRRARRDQRRRAGAA